jgi:AcrR family transcriptional regulator
MAAAVEIVRRGELPTVVQVAEAALISKSTAYRYFPSQEALVAEALLDAANRADLDAVYAAARTTGSAAARLDAVVRADHALVVNHEAAFRTAIRAMLASDAESAAALPRRPGNRLRYLSAALEPLHERLGTARLERLVSALAMCVGMESIIVTKDICGLSTDEGEAVKRWAAAALLHVALDEVTPTADEAPRRDGRHPD